jgi:hypothetical protein
MRSRLIKTPDRILERPPRGGLSICAQTSRRNILLMVAFSQNGRADRRKECPLSRTKRTCQMSFSQPKN